MAQQTIRGSQIRDGDITDVDISPSAGIQESKTQFDNVAGHDHDVVGTPTPAVLIARQLRASPSTVPNLQVRIAASTGVNLPNKVTVSVPAQTYNFSPILPPGSFQRIDLLYLDSNGFVQNKQGTQVLSSPLPPSHEGVFPIAEVGPLTSGTTAITGGMIRDVRPFLNFNPLIRVQDDALDVGYIHALNFGSNVSVGVANGVATISATGGGGGGGGEPDASTTQKGVVKVTVDPAIGLDPIALSFNDPVLAPIATALQQDGSVPLTGDLDFAGNDILNAGNLNVQGDISLEDGGVISTTNGGNIDLSPSANGKVRVLGTTALQVPSVTGIPPMPGLGDVWYDPVTDDVKIRTATGPKIIALGQTGLIGLTVQEIIPDGTNPPETGLVGSIPTIDFPKDLVNGRTIHFTFQVPQDALLTDPIKVRLAYCMSTSGLGNVAINSSYTVVATGSNLIPGSPTGTSNYTLLAPATANVLSNDDTIVIPANTLVQDAEVTVSITRNSPSGADTRPGIFRLLTVLLVYSKRDISSTENVINIFDETTDLGQVKAIKVVGNTATVTTNSGIATITVDDPTVNNASTSVKGVVFLSKNPDVSTVPVALGANETFIPTQAEKDAMAGTAGTPGIGNKFVTNQDTRLLTVNQQNALLGTVGTPSVTNKFVTNSDTRLPSAGVQAALAGAGTLPPSGSNRYVLEDYSLLPIAGEKAALAGSSGTPSNSNRYVTQQDTVLPTQTENDALQGTAGSPSNTNRYITDQDTRIPTVSEKAALAGTSGTPSGSNRFVTNSDSRLPGANLQAALAGTIGVPSATNRFVTETDTLLPTSAESAAMVGTFGTPGNLNRYVTDSDPRIPTAGEDAALAGAGVAAPSNSNRYVLEDNTRLPTANEKAALAGSSGSPSGANKYVTKLDPDLPTTAQKAALAGTAGSPSNSNRYVTQTDSILPTAAEKAAMTGTFGTPSGSNKFITQTDPTVVLTNGSRPFTSVVAGVDPTLAEHLATKAYVDFQTSTLGGDYGAPVQTINDLRAVAPAQRVDKQLRLVEDNGSVYRFDLEATGGGEAPNIGPGQWYKISSAIQVHNDLLNIQGGTTNERFHLTSAQSSGLTTGGNTTLHHHLADRLTVKKEGSDVGVNITALDLYGSIAATESPPGTVNISIPLVTSILDGLMRKEDKIKIDAIEDGAQTNPSFNTGLIYVASPRTVAVAYGLVAGTAVEGNDARVPTQNENDALQGTNGSPSNSNRYVTNSDPRNTDQRTPLAHSASHAPGSADALPLGTPVDIGTANSAGTALTYVRSDHVHNHPVIATGDLHTQYIKADGTRAFTGVVSGVTPTSASHLATKSYVDSSSNSSKLIRYPVSTNLNGGTPVGSYFYTSMGVIGFMSSAALAGDTFFMNIMYQVLPNSGTTNRDVVFSLDEAGAPPPVVAISDTITTTSTSTVYYRSFLEVTVLATSGSNNVQVTGYNISNSGFITHYAPYLTTLNLTTSSYEFQIGVSNVPNGQVNAYISLWRGRL